MKITSLQKKYRDMKNKSKPTTIYKTDKGFININIIK